MAPASMLSGNTMRKKDIWQSSYSFLGTSVHLSSDSPQFLSYMNYMYPQFRKMLSRDSSLSFQVFLENQYPPLILINGTKKFLDPKINLITQASFVIWSSIVESFNRFYLLHSSTLSFEGKGVMIVGHSGYGKTSLALRLSRYTGWKILSDSFAPIRKESCEIRPFLRSLGIRKEAADWYRVGNFLNLPKVMDSKNSGKRLLNPKDMESRISNAPANLEYIFILDSALTERKVITLPYTYVEFATFHKNEFILKELLDVEGTHLSEKYMDGYLYAYKLGIRKPRKVYGKIESILRQYESLISYKRSPKQNVALDYADTPAEINRISQEKAITYLMMHFRNNPLGFGKTSWSNLVNLSAGFSELIRGVDTYLVSSSSLEGTASKIAEIV